MHKTLKYLEQAEDVRQEKKILHKMIDIIALLFFANPAKAGRGKDQRNHSDSRTV